MSSLINWATRQLRFMGAIGCRDYLRYRMASRGTRVPITINNIHIHVRKGTPDLDVAICCLAEGEFECLRYILPRDYDGLIVDGGGYIGTAAIALSTLFPAATVITIEPSPNNFAMLELNIAAFGNIRPVRAALTAHATQDVALSDRGTGTWGFSLIPSQSSQSDRGATIRVPAVTLGALGIDTRQIGILKLDIEGTERDIFTHNTNILNCIPAIMVELHDRIVAGCGTAFRTMSKDRIIVMTGGEKYLSLRR